MTAYVFRPSRRKGGKVHKSRLYSARYKLPGQTKATTIALHVSDRQVAEAKLHEMVRELEREAVGICTPRRVRLAGQCGIEQHVKAYCSDLRARRKDEDYVTTVEKRLTKLVTECEWERIGDVTAESFQMWRERQKFAAKTLNDYLAAASALFGWLIRNEIASRNPLARVGKVDVRGNERLKRRAFTPEEFASVIAVAGEYRLALLTAYYTGLRRSEVSQLRWADVLRKAEGTFLMVRAAIAKNRLTKALYVPGWFARELMCSKPTVAAECDLVLPPDKLPSIWAFRTLLKRAGVPYKDSLGRQADFHAIRRSLNTHLAQKGWMLTREKKLCGIANYGSLLTSTRTRPRCQPLLLLRNCRSLPICKRTHK